MSKEQLNADEIRIQGLVDGVLKRNEAATRRPSEGHLDEDLLTAFVEGNLIEREAQPVVSHLTDCGFCRNVTVNLVRMEMALSDSDAVQHSPEKEPSKVSAILNTLFGDLFGADRGAVFAHEEKEDEAKDDDKDN